MNLGQRSGTATLGPAHACVPEHWPTRKRRPFRHAGVSQARHQIRSYAECSAFKLNWFAASDNGLPDQAVRRAVHRIRNLPPSPGAPVFLHRACAREDWIRLS